MRRAIPSIVIVFTQHGDKKLVGTILGHVMTLHYYLVSFLPLHLLIGYLLMLKTDFSCCI